MKTLETIEIYSVEQLELASFLDCEPSEVELENYDHYGLQIFSIGSQEYAIGTDTEADNACKENIKDSVWAFNAVFLASETGLPEEMFSFASEQCESANDAILKVIEQSCGLDDFVNTAISYDGRGHFLSSYDGEETEKGDLFIYRIN